MILFKKAEDINKFLSSKKEEGHSIGFVPTMGALHQGHMSLLLSAKKSTSLSVCSIFVNPTQFNDTKDFENYPTTLENDIDLLEKAGCDILFLPTVSEMYPEGMKTTYTYDLGYLETVLEGKFRPGHFQGVCQVVHRLLKIIPADQLYLGQKDYQQCMVIKKLITQIDATTNITICPTLRETGGLAMSSRNIRLTKTDRIKALKIFETLSFIKNNLNPGDVKGVPENAIQKLITEGLKVDYIEIADAHSLELLKKWDGKTPIIALIAAFVQDIRLIDNMLL